MTSNELWEKFKEAKERAKKTIAEDQQAIYLAGWLDCALYVTKDNKNE